MGNNLNLVQMLNVPEIITCPKCGADHMSFFDDYDVDCGNPNESPGEWNLSCWCSNCDHSYKSVFKVTAIKPSVKINVFNKTEHTNGSDVELLPGLKQQLVVKESDE